MAGGADKKASARKKRATLVYGGVVAAANLLFFGVRLGWKGDALSRREWTGVLFLAGCYALSLFSLIPSAALDVTPEAALDLLGLALLTQLGALYSPRAWYLLALIPVYFVYSFGSPLLSLVGGFGGASTDKVDVDGVNAAHDKEMEAKRARRTEHKAKRQQVVGR